MRREADEAGLLREERARDLHLAQRGEREAGSEEGSPSEEEAARIAADRRPWVPCPAGCENPWCELHQEHAFECPCPPIG